MMKSLIYWLMASAVVVAEVPTPAVEMQSAAVAVLGQLDDAAKQKACFPLSDDSRLEFRFTPRDRSGLMIKQMTPGQREATQRLLKSVLSEKGLLKATQIMSLEGVLAEMEKKPDFRDPEKYYLSIFGKPGAPEGWGWKFEGHHLSLNYTIAGDGKVSVTPSFMGTNPAEVRQGPLKGLRVLAAEEDLAHALLESLLKAGKKEVVFSEKSPEETLTKENRKAEMLAVVGVLAKEMTDGQKQALMELVKEFTGRHRADQAAEDMKQIQAAGVDAISFGWSGSVDATGAWYYRIQGPTFLIEVANSQNQANHIHSTWRSFKGDFGQDILGEHYHHHQEGQ